MSNYQNSIKQQHGMKRKAEKKIDLVIAKLQDLYYMNCNDLVIKRLEHVLEAARNLETAIQDENNWKRQ
jgi:predicted RNA-binding protein with EMAP domain